MQSFDNAKIGVHLDLLGMEGMDQSTILYSDEDSKADGVVYGRVLVNNHNNQI